MTVDGLVVPLRLGATIRAIDLHAAGEPGRVIVGGFDLNAADAVVSGAAAEGVDLETIGRTLEHEGVVGFCDSYEQLLSRIDSRVRRLAAAA